MNRIFHTHSSSTSNMAWDTDSSQILYTKRMYNPRIGYEMREVSINEEEWLAIVKYGEQAGFQLP